MGKHDARHAPGRAAKKNTGKKPPKALLWVILGVAVIGAAAAALAAAGAFRPSEVDISAIGEETVERPAVEIPEEETLPADETEGAMPAEGPEEAPGEIAAPEEPAEGPVEEVQITGEFAPELEVLPEDGGFTEEELVSGEAADTDGVEHEPWLEPGKGEEHHIYVQKNGLGMAAAEFLTRNGIVVASAEVTYANVAGMDDEIVTGIARGFTDVLPAEAKESEAELLWERQGDWLLLVTVLRDLDNGDNLAYYGDLGLMRMVDGNVYYLEDAEEFLLELGYVKEQ